MEYRQLGNTGMKVSELCFGALPMGPRQKNLDVDTCTRIIKRALEGGVNFIDTAQIYETYEPIRRAVHAYDGELIIATKATAATYEDMERAIQEAREKLELDYIHIFHLHAARATERIFEERSGALRCLLDAREKGLIGAVGISTHGVAAVRKAATEKEIDVIFPLVNIKGMGIIDGSRADMLAAIAAAVAAGKGVYLMKALAGGNLLDNYQEAIDFARRVPGIAAVAVGMVSEAEVDYNLRYFNGEDPGKIEIAAKEFAVVETVCSGDGACLKACTNDAITLVNGKARINRAKCLLCGYCTEVCPQFAIRMI
ncbi:Aldo/keto reductase family protein [Neomoorella glycerini]|uniref:Aldo/keto reductase family protein n=1 Tax=Neomoorella glycerini TaxID=55779 RepID=A0A6I5ZU39_9FIRM|nr:aldo/keto reductase [Moorella glycerini]QGP93047.1 Aldo/keto reductase family protein [Moorella glycerini]